MKCAGNADLIIYVADATRNLDDNDKKILDFVKGRHVIVLLNKTDVENVLSVEQMRAHTDFLFLQYPQGSRPESVSFQIQ